MENEEIDYSKMSDDELLELYNVKIARDHFFYRGKKTKSE